MYEDFFYLKKDAFSLKSGFSIDGVDDAVKDALIQKEVGDSLNKLAREFKYGNLDGNLEEDHIEILTHSLGYSGWIEHNGEVICIDGNLGGPLNEKKKPTKFRVSNAYLDLYQDYTIGKDCVIMQNNSSYLSVLPTLYKYASLIVECELSILVSIFWHRIPAVFSASDNNTIESVNDFISGMKNGKFSAVGESAIFEDFKSHQISGSASSKITDLIETLQYLKAQRDHAIGLNANYNMKRERLSESEIGLNDMTLLPGPDDEYECRQKAIKEVNSMFGRNYTVEFSSSWKAEHENICNHQEGEEFNEDEREKNDQ